MTLRHLDGTVRILHLPFWLCDSRLLPCLSHLPRPSRDFHVPSALRPYSSNVHLPHLIYQNSRILKHPSQTHSSPTRTPALPLLQSLLWSTCNRLRLPRAAILMKTSILASAQRFPAVCVRWRSIRHSPRGTLSHMLFRKFRHVQHVLQEEPLVPFLPSRLSHPQKDARRFGV